MSNGSEWSGTKECFLVHIFGGLPRLLTSRACGTWTSCMVSRINHTAAVHDSLRPGMVGHIAMCIASLTSYIKRAIDWILTDQQSLMYWALMYQALMHQPLMYQIDQGI